ncbi:hypothetical protein Pyn_10291 [Prunus yedoensis var. nudiflora]|uniref:B-like cyclin n=1 Tax=Prunus yedoensis var. nudiflora TaxID=2094558 RepID=A0A314XL96_PRUYE|nr:hypothetical protein Pyn_10291 [Prunus yedoensis var. nudiflora]
MADSFDCANSNLLCAENSDTCFDDLNSNTIDDLGLFPSMSHKIDNTHNQDPSFNHNRSKSMIDFPLQSEEGVSSMVKRESEHFPRDDYLKRLRNGDLDLSSRREALDWISKAHAHYSFGPLSVCLSMNYLDRFLSLYELPRGKAWAVQLLAVACLSIAAKVEETTVPQSVDLQIRTTHIEHNKRPSEIAAAVAICISGETQAVNIDKAISCFMHVDKVRVLKCLELIKDLSLISGSANRGSASASSVPQSPVGVLDAACLSYKSDEFTVGSCANSSHKSPDIKRRKPDNPSRMDSES